MVSIKQKSDFFGVAASSLCLIHCIVTPFLFIAQAHVTCCAAEAPDLWKSLDYAFLAISFVAIYWSTKNTAKEWIKFALWISWGLLFFTIFNEKTQWFAIPEYFIYLPSLGLVFFHIYNLKFCKCKEDKCCSNG
ncbi:MerC domain-containing protein [Polaribacter porphyrae]|uniref:MerC domain-containing protein n=1 Tax=Polaribacter porphyrae TaxID=1137780 RepID=A0A2S7WLQ0_9FLAO|nr:MerC domain-containing protein [Polaribacter porphyrae]PQJ78242.1 hypothetical protein BTO18_03120 [Polaribacter porphyrae]